MSTEAQINANRQNAQKSTGPVTEQGKAAVSQNALKHGLFAVRDVIPTESQQEFELMREQMLAQLAPAGAVESMLAQRAISLAWRLKRAETMQSQAIEEMLESHISSKQWHLGRRTPKDPSEEPEYLALGKVAKEDWCGRRVIERLFEYERRIEKSLFKTMAELRAMQAARLTAQVNQVNQTEDPARGDKEINSEEQSQSGADEAPPETVEDKFKRWPTTFGIDPKELTAFLKKTYGDRYPEMVKVIVNRHNGSRAQPQAACGSQADSGGNGEDLPLSLSRA